MGERFVVVGTSGSGKTTVAGRIARRLGIPHVELDSLHWEADWQPAEISVFRQRVVQATGGDTWVVDGNYSKVRDIVWPRATTVLWLDYPLWFVMWRVIKRTLRRSLGRQVLWQGNRESFRQSFLSRDSIIVWSLTTYHRRRRQYPALFARLEYSHLTVLRHRSPRQTEKWLDSLTRL